MKALALKELYCWNAYGQAGRPFTIGNASSSHSLTSPNDLIVEGNFEVNGTSFFDGGVQLYENLAFMISGKSIVWGGATATSTRTQLNFNNSTDQFVLGLGSDQGRQLVLSDAGNTTSDHDHAVQTNPTLFVHSATDPDTANTQWTGILHDTSQGIIETGAGDLWFKPVTDVVRFGTHSALAAETLSGYITVKDSAGNSRKIGVIS